MKDLSNNECVNAKIGAEISADIGADINADISAADIKVADIKAADIKAAAARVQMPLLSAEARAKSFSEVAAGYTCEQAVAEAKRCLNCKKPACMGGCPVGVRIPEFIALVAGGEFEKAYEVISSTNSLPAVTGRVCPQENQCERFCVRGIKGEPVAIGNLERFVADYHAKNVLNAKKAAANGAESLVDECENVSASEVGAKNVGASGANGAKKSVAIIGSGPSGLSAAGDLAARGYLVTVFEALHKGGGVLTYGIPQFRLPKSVVAGEIEKLEGLGVKFVYNAVAGKSFNLSELKAKFGAVFIASGAGLPRFMKIPGEELAGVFSANEFLTRINLMKAYDESSKTPVKKGKKVIIVGGGNVAMDAARSALRLGGEVTVVYRRTEAELPARREEVLHAKQEGIVFSFLTNPVQILGENGEVCGVRLQKMELGEPDDSGRRSPVAVENSEYDISADVVIMALGTSPNPIIRNGMPEIVTDRRGCISVDEKLQTSVKGVYAGGDAVSGAATVILAMGAGRKAAASIDEYLSGKAD